MKQRCYCETCGATFLEMDAIEYVKLHHFVEPIVLSVIDIPIEELTANLESEINSRLRKFDKWYITAMKHWIKNPTHDIIVSAPIEYTPSSPLNAINIVVDHKKMYEMFGRRYLNAQAYVMENAWEESFPI